MKRTNLLVCAAIACAFSAGATTSEAASPCTVFNGDNQSGRSAGVGRNRVYSGSQIPRNLNNRINSIRLLKGFGVVIGNNNNGVGESRFYQAASRDLKVNLSNTFKNKVSFIRVIVLDTNTQKKGQAGGDTALASATNASWYYNWAGGSNHTNGLEYVPMRWGGGSPSNIGTYATSLQTKNSVHLLTFNEPDNRGQSNIRVSTALDRYEVLLKSGLRMGSPACEQDNYRTWLNDFMDGCADRNLRVDFIALHWYDWGNQNNNSTGNQIKNRMTAKVLNARNLVGPNMGIWMTEFNANRNRSSQQIHKDFINSAIGYINNQNWWERYSYFRVAGGDFGPSNRLTTSGKAYRDAPNKTAGWRQTNNKGWQ